VMVFGVLSYYIPFTRALSYLQASRRDWDVLLKHLRALTEGAKELKLHRQRRDAFFTGSLEPTADSVRYNGVRGDSIYAVSPRSLSLAHVIPASAVVMRRPIHGLDIGPVEAYVAALEDPQYPLASFHWTAMDQAEIRTTATPDQRISVQITYERGWEATANGHAVAIRGDAIGQLVIAPGCDGPCNITLHYTEGNERIATRGMSVAAMLAALLWAFRGQLAGKHRPS